ncbi:MAG TPA: DUF1007 family protein [Xanthobacteraceae bacterium]|nr:DUF1007 family protein [Xanthobacteraceae bacterium]
MIRALGLSVAALLGLAAAPAQAHPHVWVTMHTELLYAPDGRVSGLRHAWTFDDMFSEYATQGLEQKVKGQFTREELKPLAEENVTSLKEYEFFNHVHVEGKQAKDIIADPKDYWLDYQNETLTLNFTLPFKEPVASKDLRIDIYDPEFFVSFSFADAEPVKLAGAPAACSLATKRPGEDPPPSSQRLDKSFQASDANAGMGAHYASKILVTCP